MKIEFSQLQFAVTQAMYEAFCNKTLSTEEISVDYFAGRITKNIGEQDVIPRIGEHICDSFWYLDHPEQKVIDICYFYDDDCCTVYLEPYVFLSGCTLHQELQRIAELHGWEYHQL